MKLLVKSIILSLIFNDLYILGKTLDTSKWQLDKVKHRKSIDAAVTQYYEQKTFMMSISVYLEYSQLWQNYVMDYLSDALTHSKFMKYEIFINTTNHWQPMTKDYYHNLWYVDSDKAFRSILGAVEQNNKVMGEYVVIMDTAKSLNQRQEVKLILEKSYEVNIVNIVVAAYEASGTFILYSYDMFKPDQCWQVVVEQVNIFQNGRFQNEQLFPYKFQNFHSCPLTMYIRNTSLFFRFNMSQDGTQIASIEGVEANMIQTMAAKLNFRLNMFYKNENYSVGHVFENGTAVGPFRYLIDNKLDVLLGYYHYPIRNHHFGESTSYAFMPLVIVISESQKNEFTQVWPLKPFKPMAWYMLALLCLIVVIIVQLAHSYLKKTVTWIDVVGLVLGNSRPIHLNRYMTKISFLLCIFGVMILCATFQGRLYYVFNADFKYAINTVQQLVEANYTFIITRRFNTDIIRSLHIPFKQIQFVDAVDDYWIYEYMRKHSTTSNTATFTNYWDFQMYIDSKKCYDEFDILPMTVVLNQICAYTKNHSYLIEPINRIIVSLKYAGILYKWLTDLENVQKTNEINPMTTYQLSHNPLPLTTKKFETVFVALMSLYLISLLTFLGELVVRKWEKLHRICKKIKF